MADDIPTQEELTKLRVVDLRKKLTALALPTGGNKAELVSRLHDHYTDQVNVERQAGEQEQDETMDTAEPDSGSSDTFEDEMDVKEEESINPESGTPHSVDHRHLEAEKQRLEEERAREGEAELQDKRESEERAVQEAELQAKREAEERAREEAELQAKRESEERAREEAELQAKKEAEERARQETELQAKIEAEEKARQEAELQARRAAEEARAKHAADRAEVRRREVEEKTREKAEEMAKKEAEEKARLAAIESAKRMAEKQARMEAEQMSKQEKIAAKEAARLQAEQRKREEETLRADKERLEKEEQARQASMAATLAEEARARKETAQLALRGTFTRNNDADDESEEKERLTKNQLRKRRKKNRAERRRQAAETVEDDDVEEQTDDSGVEVEYVQEEPLIDSSNPLFNQFNKIFQTFKIEDPVAEPTGTEQPSTTTSKMKEENDPNKPKRGADHFGELEVEERQVDKSKLSKKKLKKLTRMTVAELKTVVTRPDLVEMHDVCGPDPKLLLALKATRNTVPVPRHWCNKRKYLQGKRGVEKPPFELPDYIIATGIMEMRQALAEKEEEKSLKQKMREKVRPKMGKIDIDYQKLHDAFFKHQRKPKMTVHGDLYYEGKEFETKLKEKKPGNLTDELRTALGMPIGAGAEKFPPPWLIAMQRYGPPPSYPNLKLQGLNCPIPEGCSFGYHAGGWGKPPVDELGKPLYGDVFGQAGGRVDAQPITDDNIDHKVWGEMESESSEEEESSEESGDEKDEDIAEGLVTPADAGLITPSGMTSIPAGLETPDAIELRKRIEDAMDQGGETPSLYQVLPEKRTSVGAAMMGSAHTYDVASAKRVTSEGIEVALNPEELDLDNVAMQAKYDQTVRAQQANVEKEDLSDMVAEHAAKAAKKRKKMQNQDKASKKHKDFKF